MAIVAAVGSNRAIGSGDRLPWRLPSDLKRYRNITMGKPMVMGRKTFQSIGRPLPGRQTIIVTRDPTFTAAGAHVVGSLPAALELAAEQARSMGADEIIIAGGGDIYAQLIGEADVLRITEVELAPDGDAFFPPIDPHLWRETSRHAHPASHQDEAPFAFVDYIRADRQRAAG